MNSIRIMIIVGLVVLLICKIIVYCIDKKNPVDHVNPREQVHCDLCDDECHNLLTIRMCRDCWQKFWDEKLEVSDD